MSYVLTFNFQSNLGERNYLKYFILMNAEINLDRLPLQNTECTIKQFFDLCRSHISRL